MFADLRAIIYLFIFYNIHTYFQATGRLLLLLLTIKYHAYTFGTNCTIHRSSRWTLLQYECAGAHALHVTCQR